jgi:hypothetical protein
LKATINGIAVEGTPQEIMEFQRLQNEKNGIKSIAPMDADKIKDYQDVFKYAITSIGGSTLPNKGCPNNAYGCYCTGACK